MIEVDFESEDVLWKLFRTTTLPENGHELPGERAYQFHYVRDVLHGKSKKPSFKLKNDDRFYYLRSRSTVAVVPQSALLKVGRVMHARDRSLFVQYLGTNPEGDGSSEGIAPPFRDGKPLPRAKAKTRKTRQRAPGSNNR